MATKSRVYDELPPAPTDGDIVKAQHYHGLIMELLHRDDVTARDDPARLTRAERANLQRLDYKWLARATGADRRWAVVGSKPGRLPRAMEASLRPAPHPEWERPLAPGEVE